MQIFAQPKPPHPDHVIGVLLRCLQTNTQLDDIASRIGEPRDIEDHESREVRPRTGLPCQGCACLPGAPGEAQTHLPAIRVGAGLLCTVGMRRSLPTALLPLPATLTLHCAEAQGCFLWRCTTIAAAVLAAGPACADGGDAGGMRRCLKV